MQKLFDESIKGITPEQEARARHILVEKEDEANAIVARLKAGEDFAKIAADMSKDPGSGKEGGDLGYFTKDRMVPEFAEAAFKLKPGEISDAGEEPVWLARHQARGAAHQAAAFVRRREGPDCAIRHPQGADRRHRGAPRQG